MDARLTAAVAGAGAGLRSVAPVAVLAARGRGPFPGPARFIAFGAAAGELIADKQPQMGSRWARRGLTLRVSGSALVGADRAGASGALIAVAAALAAARAGSLARARVADGHGRGPGLGVAVAEDALCYALLALATG